MQIGIEVKKFDRQDKDGIRLPTRNDFIIWILFQIYILKYGHHTDNLLSFFGQARFVKNQSPTRING